MSGFEIRTVRAREVLDCRLEPTLRVTVETDGGHRGRADVPAGRSTGTHEAVERRDGGDRFRGKGVRGAVRTVEEELEPALAGTDVRDQRAVDDALRDLDGTGRFAEIGANASTGTSLAVLKAAADGAGVPLYRRVATVAGRDGETLPIPLLDVIEGGELAATDLDFQEHQLLPTGAETFAEAIRMGAEVYYELGDRLEAEHGSASRNVGVEGGYTPPGMTDPRDAFDAMLGAVEECGYADSFVLGIDAAATHFYDAQSGTYSLMGETHTPGEMVDVYDDLASTYPLESIEDPLDESDFSTTAAATDRLDCQVVGDDLFVTSADRVEQGVDVGAANALLFKINQVGTVTGAFDAAATAREHGYAVQVSERSGQTPDTWLADVAVGLDAGQIKTGVTRGERTEQYNRLLRIEERLGEAGAYGDWPPTP
ncbi:MAG: phosphopyruvate hydratase [Haloarculaceae archaeon]